jgi:hypothetical protein
VEKVRFLLRKPMRPFRSVASLPATWLSLLWCISSFPPVFKFLPEVYFTFFMGGRCGSFNGYFYTREKYFTE